MHSCRQTQKKLIDLVFGEIETIEQQRALAELRSCADCSEQYQTMLASLNAFDQAADAAIPEESYWTGYEARLRARLAEPAPQTSLERLAAWFAGLLAKPAIPITAVATLALLVAVSIFWATRQQKADPVQMVAEATPSPAASPSPVTPEPKAVEQNNLDRFAVERTGQTPRIGTATGRERDSRGQTLPTGRGTDPYTQSKSDLAQVPQATVAEKRRQGRSRTVAKPEVETSQPAQNDVVAANLPQINYTPVTVPEIPAAVSPAVHFEKAQLLLRSFRNAEFETAGAAFDLPYEKQRANKLIYDNILLRREAEAKGYLPVEEALTSLEPLLLDIANLPDKPSQGEMLAIKERIQKQEIIATLNVVSSGADRFNLPARYNR